jgi:hypothetical protein
VTLRLDGRTLVNEQIAEIDIGIAQVVAEDIFTEMLEKQLAGRRFPIELAALVAGAIKGDIGFPIISHEAAEERWQEPLSIFDQASDHLLGIEGWSLLSKIDKSVHFAGLR